MCFVRISEQTAIIFLRSTDWLDYITELEVVYCAVSAKPITQLIQFSVLVEVARRKYS
jgi:hypothetical protein